MSETPTPAVANLDPAEEFNAQRFTEVYDEYLTNNALATVNVDEHGVTTRSLRGRPGTLKSLGSTTTPDGVTNYTLFAGYDFSDGHTSEYSWSNEPDEPEVRLQRTGPQIEDRPAKPREIWKESSTAFLDFELKKPEPQSPARLRALFRKAGQMTTRS